MSVDTLRTRGKAMRLSIFLAESSQYHHRPLYTEIVHRAHVGRLAGATVFRGVEGYGSHRSIHRSHWFKVDGDLPMVIVIVDTEDRVRGFLDELETLHISATCVLDAVQVERIMELDHRRTGAKRPKGE